MDDQCSIKSANTVKQMIAARLEVPRLSGVSVRDFIGFQQLRNLYERNWMKEFENPTMRKAPLPTEALLMMMICELLFMPDWFRFFPYRKKQKCKWSYASRIDVV